MKDKWILVKDQLPPDDRLVLVYRQSHENLDDDFVFVGRKSTCFMEWAGGKLIKDTDFWQPIVLPSRTV